MDSKTSEKESRLQPMPERRSWMHELGMQVWLLTLRWQLMRRQWLPRMQARMPAWYDWVTVLSRI